MKIHLSILCMLLLACLGHLDKAQGQNGPPWVMTNVGYNYILRGIDFPAGQDLTGYIAGESLTYNGNGIVLKTTDGGNTWTPVWTGTNMGLEGSCFIDENTGFVAGWPKTSMGWSGFGKTTDGGSTWSSPVVVPDVYFFTDIVFKDALHGIILGSTNTSPGVWYTSDGGMTWTPSTGADNGVPYKGCHVSGNTYFLVDNGGRIKKSVNNGQTWTTVYTIPGGLLTGIDFYDDNTGMACGDYGVIARTTDGGTTWQVQQVGSDIWRDFGWQDPDHVFCCGTPELVAESLDGGLTWGNGFPGTTLQSALYECIFTANGSGFICGSQGALLKRQPSCTAGFSAGQTGICTGESIQFTDLSAGTISTWDWYFEGGSPSTSNDPDPLVNYAAPGTFDVRLIVNNGYWSDTLLYENYITVTQPVTPVVTATGNLLSSSAPMGNQWHLDGLPIQGAIGQSWLATQSGWYSTLVTLNGCVTDSSNRVFIVMAGLEENNRRGLLVMAGATPGTIAIRLADHDAGMVSVTVYNSRGIRVFKTTRATVATNGWIYPEAESLVPGLYMVVVNDGTFNLVGKALIR